VTVAAEFDFHLVGYRTIDGQRFCLVG
jgi:hypothetical protein